MVKAGWKLEFRVHGIELPKPEMNMKAALGKPDHAPELEIILEFSPELKSPITVLALPRYIPAGQQILTGAAHQPSVLKNYTAPGCFLTVTASVYFEIPSSVERDFLSNPEENARALPPILEEKLREHVRPAALLAAGAFAVSMPDGVFELRAEQQLYWHSDSESQGFADSLQTAESIGLSSLELSAAKEILQSVVAALRERSSLGRQLGRAAYHFILGRQNHPGTVVRFLEMFLVLETLAATAEAKENTEYDEKSKQLLSVIKEYSPNLLEFTHHLVSQSPSLNQSFALLAKSLYGDASEQDIQIFRDINRLRGAYVHGRSDEPIEQREQEIFLAADQLATKYLKQILENVKLSALSQGKVVEL